MPLPSLRIRRVLLRRLDTMRREALDQLHIARVERDHEHVDRAEEAEDDRVSEVTRGVDAIARRTLREVEDARARMQSSAYGTCMTCTMEIAQERLVAHPTAVRCARCQAAFDCRAASTARTSTTAP